MEKIDELNGQDPHMEMIHDFAYPRELVYSQKLTAWVLRLNPKPSEALRIAARGQHVQRWTIPRDTYPMDRGGYLRWREDLKKFHAGVVAGLMKDAGYDGKIIKQVETIILKKELKENPDVQTIEDALCLVFLEDQFSDLRSKTPEEKMTALVLKTWKKMSKQGRELAKTISFSDEDRAYLGRVLGF